MRTWCCCCALGNGGAEGAVSGESQPLLPPSSERSAKKQKTSPTPQPTIRSPNGTPAYVVSTDPAGGTMKLSDQLPTQDVFTQPKVIREEHKGMLPQPEHQYHLPNGVEGEVLHVVLLHSSY